MIGIKEVKKFDNKLVFTITDIDYVTANTIRRLIMEEVPVLAVDNIVFKENNSALYDEIIAHRLGLTPLTTDLKSYNLKEECKCEGKGCSLCQLILTLQAKGPCIVYAKDIKSKDKGVKPVFGDIPIVQLLKGQEIEVEMIAILGKGKVHSKFSPGLAYYRAYPEVKILNNEKAKKAVSVCPRNVLKLENDKVKVVNLYECDLNRACVDATDKDTIKISGSDSDFIFTIESWGQLEAKEILMRAVDILDDKLDRFSKSLNKIVK